LVEVAINEFLQATKPRDCFFPSDKFDVNAKIVCPLLVEYVNDVL